MISKGYQKDIKKQKDGRRVWTINDSVILAFRYPQARTGKAASAARETVFLNEDKKQVPLRLSQRLYESLAAWAEAEFRSVNGQIEYLLTECVKKREKSKDGEDSLTDKKQSK